MVRKHIIPLLLVLVTLFSCTVVSHASYSSEVTSFWDRIVYGAGQSADGIPLLGNAIQAVAGNLSGNLCVNSSDGLHHATHFSGETGSDAHGAYSVANCQYCGDSFRVYGADIEDAYNQYVINIQNNYGTTQIGSTGYELPVSVDHYSPWYVGSFSSSIGEMNTIVASASSSKGYVEVYLEELFAPVDGYYTFVVEGVFDNSHFVVTTGVISSGERVIRTVDSRLTYGPKGARGLDYKVDAFDVITSARFRLYFWVEPYGYSPNDFSAPFGGINSRPTSWEGINYGIIGDDGDLSVDNSNKTIVNETNNTVYNPATGETSNITDWSYNYEDRSYKVTTESGDTITVTYGDESIVYKQGDTIYNIYYVAPGGSEDPVPTPTPCQHDWYGLVTLEPTCIYTGVKTFQCRKCSETYKEQIPATGHTWVIKETITTSYDEKGDLVQQGYTIYRCTVCGEEYKDTAGTGPPNGNEDSPSGGESGTSGTFSGIFGLLVDFLNFFFGTFKDFIGSGIKNFFTSLADGASDIFGLLNPFNWS